MGRINMVKLLGLLQAFAVGFLICVILSLFFSCKSSKKMTNEQYRSEVTISVDTISIDSTITHISNSTLDVGLESITNMVIEEYSDPDSLGNQHLKKKTTINKRVDFNGQSATNDSSSVVYAYHETKADSGKINEYVHNTTTKENKPPEWIAVSVGIVLLILLFIGFRFILRLKD